MKQTLVLCAAILLISASAKAQASSYDASSNTPATASFAAVSPTDTPSLSASAAVPQSPAEGALEAATAGGSSAKPANQEPPPVYGVFQTYNWQATVGYTFFRLYIVPRVNTNMNGLNLGLVWYPKGLWVGADGEFIGTWGSAFGETTKYAQGMGGPRFRWAAPHGIEVWGHGLVGGAHLLPQTPFGGQGAFAYEVGGGVDINVHQKRWAYRASANMVGTRFFDTYQYSPNVSVGVVFKF